MQPAACWSVDQVSSEALSLSEALVGATEAPPDRRIEYRDAIARHGHAGIDAVEPWILDPVMFRFAVRVIVRAGDFGFAEDARSSLRRFSRDPIPPDVLAEVDWGLGQLGARKARQRDRPRGLRNRLPWRPRTSSSLVEPTGDAIRTGLAGGQLAERRQLPARRRPRAPVLRPSCGQSTRISRYMGGDTTYRYFGAWSGTGDMELDAVNRTILARSPNLLLLTRSGDGWRFEGYFSCDAFERQRTTREGAEFQASCFFFSELRRPTRPLRAGEHRIESGGWSLLPVVPAPGCPAQTR